MPTRTMPRPRRFWPHSLVREAASQQRSHFPCILNGQQESCRLGARNLQVLCRRRPILMSRMSELLTSRIERVSGASPVSTRHAQLNIVN